MKAFEPQCVALPPISELTFGIKTFMRTHARDRLIRSIRSFYPDARIAVADDSPKPQPLDDLEAYHILPTDCGISAGRNFLADHVQTPWLCLLDDDFVFTSASRIELLLAVSAATGGVAAGQVKTRGKASTWYGRISREGSQLFLKRDWEARQLVTDYGVVRYLDMDLVLNFFVAPTALIRKVRWDDRLKVGEHMDFMMRLQEAHANVSLCPDIWVRHQPYRPPDYRKYRGRRNRFYKLFQQTRGISGSAQWVPIPTDVDQARVRELRPRSITKYTDHGSPTTTTP